MAQPEKDRKDESNKDVSKAEPRLDAILPTSPAGGPDNIAPAAAELIGDIDSYQRKMEEQWSTAKNSYEKKINQIMEEFLKKDLPASLSDDKSAKNPTPPKEHAEVSSRFEGVLARVERELQENSYRQKNPSMINITWQPELFRMSRLTKVFLRVAGAALVVGILYLLAVNLPITHSLPYAHTLGPVVMNDRIYVMDWFRKSLMVHKVFPGFPIVAIENVPSSHATGLALSNKYLFTADGVGRSITRHHLTADHEMVSTLPAPGESPAGLFFDGSDLWSGDPVSRSLYRHRGNEWEDIRDEFAIPNDVYLTAFFLHNNRVWTLDGKSRMLGIYRLQKPLKLLASIDLDRFLKGATPTGAARKGKVLYLVTENPSRLIRIPIQRLKKAASFLNSSDWQD